MVKSGYKPSVDHRDWDYIKNKAPHFAATGVPELPVTLGHTLSWIPNQNTTDTQYNIPPLPEGCTEYVQSYLSWLQTKVFRSPMDLEKLAHANQNGGADIRDIFMVAIQLGWFKSFYNVTAQGTLDWFDAFKICLWLGKDEVRALSAGTPWFAPYEQIGSDGILPLIPTPPELRYGFFGTIQSLFKRLFGSVPYSWHNWMIYDFETYNGTDYLLGISLQGKGYGDNGVHRISREVINSLMEMRYTNTFAGLQVASPTTTPFTVDLTWTEKVVSFVHMVANNYVLR